MFKCTVIGVTISSILVTEGANESRGKPKWASSFQLKRLELRKEDSEKGNKDRTNKKC
jgi:hypothetical protein